MMMKQPQDTDWSGIMICKITNRKQKPSEPTFFLFLVPYLLSESL